MITGGFGINIDLKTGASRSWYIDKEGKRRWVNDDKIAEEERKEYANIEKRFIAEKDLK